MQPICADYHTHSFYSPDGKSSPRDLCEAAVGKGLSEIAITDHYEFFKYGAFADRFSIDRAKEGAADILNCREAFKGRLQVTLGVEMGQPHTDPELAKRLLEEIPFDYVIGSVHKLENIDLGLTDYPDEAIPGRVEENFRFLSDLAENSDFDCLGHLDIIKRYAARHGKRIDLLDYREPLVRLLKTLIEKGRGLEINTSGLRQEAKEALPSLGILKLYRELGGEILTVGSDAHCPQDVAADFSAARELALQAGFQFLATFKARRCSFYPIG